MELMATDAELSPPLVVQASVNDGAYERQPPVFQQPLAAHFVISLEDALRNFAIISNPNIVHIEIDGLSRKKAVRSLVYHLRLFGEPRPSLKILTDVRAKEYANSGANSDTVEVSMSKKRETCLGKGFNFSLLQGIQMDDDGRIGPSIFNSVDRSAETLLMFSENDSISEKVTVPPRTRTTVTVKTNLVKYDGEATIDVQANASRVITYKYFTNSSCNCCQSTKGYGEITMGQLFRGQPNFKVFGASVYYTAKYYYTYFGEQFDVQKTEARI